MVTGILHSHTLFVSIYILIFIIKLVLLLGNKQVQLDKFRKRTRIFEMILPLLFLGTGVYLALNSAYIGETWFIFKVVALVLAIGLGVLTFRTNNKIFGVLTLLLFLYIFGISYTKTPDFSNRLDKIAEAPAGETFDPSAADYDIVAHGASVYKRFECAKCHGETGDLGLSGARDLSRSSIPDTEITAIIKNGKNVMQAYGDKMTKEELAAVTQFVKSLRK